MQYIRLVTGLMMMAAILLAVSVQSISAQDREEIGTLASPADIQKFREEFIKNFHRTGLNTTIGDAAFLRIMVECTNAQRGLEVGSFNGFGAINMGMGFERNGGHLFTLELDPETADKCRENIKKVGLEKTVTCITGDALQTIPKLKGKFDFVFLDAAKQDYFNYFKACLPMLKVGSVIIADNVVQSARAMKDFLDFMENDPDYDMVIIRASEEKGDGMAVIYKLK
ncbi:MAG: methyltransferase domain-containing protein [Candidatus Omnitrophota bacterium]|jgi:predicted O-methyltransferase YrrM|nr:MAG: methyltransferase domain-containing protein [Candidatus Omnitrophota bacterium]